MTATIEAPAPAQQHHFPQGEMPPFASGNSQTQALEMNPGNGQQKIPLTPKGMKEKVVHFMRHRFGPEHLFGSVMTVFYLHRWSTNVQSTYPDGILSGSSDADKSKFRAFADDAKATFTPGKVKEAVKGTSNPMRAMMAGSYLAFFTNLLVFFWDRGGTPPKGNNLAEKTLNSFKHPNLSTMFTNCVMMGAALLGISGGKVVGGISQLKGLKSEKALEKARVAVNGNEELAKDLLGLNKRAETMRVASGLFYLCAVPITYISMFNMGDKEKKQEQSAPELSIEQEADKVKAMAYYKSSQTKVLSFTNLKKALEPYKPKNALGALAYAFKNDKAGAVARSCMVAAEFLQMGEGWARSSKKAEVLQKAGVDEGVIKKEIAGSKKAMVSGMWGAGLTIGHAVYAYGRVLAESKQKGSNGQEMVR